MRTTLVALIAIASNLALANGWECESVESETRLPVEVKVYNYTSEKSTKTPAVFIVSKAGDTAVVRKGRRSIKKEILTETVFSGAKRENVKYSVEGGDDEDDTDVIKAFDTAELLVNGNPDKENQDPKKPNLKEGQKRAGKLAIKRDGSPDTNVDLECSYYVKWQRQAKKAK